MHLLSILAALLAVGSLPTGPVKPMPFPKPNKPLEPVVPIQPSKAKPKPKPKPTCGTIKLRIPDIAVDRLLHTGGKDTEMGGSWRRLWAKAMLRHTKRDLIVSGWVRVREEGGVEASVFRRYYEQRVPLLDNSVCEISSVSVTEGSARDRYRDGHGYVKAYGNGLIDYADCRSDTNGNDEDKLGCRRIRFREIEVKTRPATTTCPDIVIPYNYTSVDGFRHVRGDTDVHGNDPYVRIDTRVDLKNSRTRAVLRTEIEIEESKPDTTTFEATHERLLFVADRDAPGCEVASVTEGTGRLRALSHPDRRERPQAYGMKGYSHNREGNVKHAVCWPDGPGDDAGRVFCNVTSNKITLDLRRK